MTPQAKAKKKHRFSLQGAAQQQLPSTSHEGACKQLYCWQKK